MNLGFGGLVLIGQLSQGSRDCCDSHRCLFSGAIYQCCVVVVSSLARGLEMCDFRTVEPTAGGCGCSVVVLLR